MHWGIRAGLVILATAVLGVCQSPLGSSGTLGKPFVTVWRVTKNSPTVTLPADPDYTYQYTVEWGDGGHDRDVNGSITHTYGYAGDYTIRISGTFPHLNTISGDRLLAMNRLEGKNAAKLIQVVSWGDIAWKSMRNMFAYCTDVELDTSTRPNLAGVHSMRNMFYGTSRFNSDISDWNVSSVTDMTGMFYEASLFDQALDRWDVSHVTTMSRMFAFATRFNHPIGDWNVSAVHSMASMFKGAAVFDQPIGRWDVSHVTDMAWMFAYAKKFNQPLGDWNVSQVTRTYGMFRFAKSFHGQDLSRWDLSRVTKRKDFMNGAGAGNVLPPDWP